MKKREIQRRVNIAFGILGAGVLAASQLGAMAQSRPLVVDDTFPNPELHDGEYTAQHPEGPISAMTMTVSGGRIVDIAADYNDHNRKSHSLNTATVETLSRAALTKQSYENLDLVSGATATSQQFIGSLQDLINQAR